MCHVPLSLYVIGKMPNRGCFSFQNADLKASIVIKMHMHTGDRDIVVVVMRVGELPGNVTGTMIVGVTQDTDTFFQFTFFNRGLT